MRGKQARKREIMPDKIYNSVELAKFINYIMLDGKKQTAQDIVYKAVESLGEEVKMNPLDAFLQAIAIIKPKVEVRSRRVGGANYQVPVPVAEERQLALAYRWIIDASRASRGAKEYWKSLKNELKSALNKEGNAYKKRDEAHKMAEANKAFSHLSW
jgi:small subunit ribosomal protein S7